MVGHSRGCLSAGYVHGKTPRICPEGCVPDANLGKDESPLQTLIREALEYQVMERPLRRQCTSLQRCLSYDASSLYGGPAVPQATSLCRRRGLTALNVCAIASMLA